MSLITLDSGVTVSFDQVLTIHSLIAKHDGHAHWHPNNCGCCMTVHAPDRTYVVSRDGAYDEFEGRGCQCPPD